MLKIWNVSLVLATGVLAILGTFLVRSGILNSIHAFGASTLGVPFLILIGVLIAGSIALVVSRADDLRTEARLDSLLSREAVFLLNNLVLVALCFVIFWGTFFPLISEALTGNEASVGPPWFDRYIVPLSLVLVLLSGIGPVIAWRRATAANLRRNLLRPALVGWASRSLPARVAGVTGSLPRADHVRARGLRDRRGRPGAVARRAGAAGDVGRLGAAGAGLARPAQPPALRRLHRACRASRCCSPAWPPRRPSRTPAMSSSRSGKTARVGGYDITYVKPTSDLRAASNGRLEKIDLGAQMRVSRGGEVVGTLHTERSFFPSADPSLGPDLALLRGRGDERGRAARRAAARRVDRDLAQCARPAHADRPRRQGVRRRRRRPDRRPEGGRAGPGARRADARVRGPTRRRRPSG